MKIKDKLTARQVAMQMATETMTALIPVARSEGYDINNHINIARGFYDWIVGNAELPEVYDQNSQTDKVMDVLMKARDNFKHEPLWLPIMPIDGKVPPLITDIIRRDLPIYLRAKGGNIKVVGSVEEFDKIVESGDISDYTEYSIINSPDPKNPFERDRRIKGMNAAF